MSSMRRTRWMRRTGLSVECGEQAGRVVGARRWGAGVFVAGWVGVVAALGYSGSASAHGADAPVAVNYVVRVESVSVGGVRVRAVEGGARLELENRSGRVVTILGLQGEEFLRVRADGVDENRRSPTWFSSRYIASGRKGGDARAAPEWHVAGTAPIVRWHEERARDLPAREWSVPLLVDGREPGVVRGSISAAAVPETGWWWTGVLVAAVALGALHRVTPLVVGVAVVGGGLVAAWLVGSAELATSATEGLGTQLLVRLWPLLSGIGLMVAGVLVAVRRADFVLAIVGACVAVMAGLPNGGVFSAGTLAGPGWGRWAVATALGAGTGLAAAGAGRWYRTTASIK